MDSELADAAACATCRRDLQTLRVHSPDGSTFLREITSWPPYWTYDAISEIRLRQSMRIYFKNNHPAKFHSDPIWNDGVLSHVHTVAEKWDCLGE